MGKNSKIEWTNHTFNPWIGCAKHGPGCANCYAEQLMDVRLRRVQWGKAGSRKRTSESYWRKPFQWDKESTVGNPSKVFCGSLCDVFEHWEPGLEKSWLGVWRNDLFHLIDQTRNLIWLLLTKRPENVLPMIAAGTGRHPEAWLADNKHVWIGASASTQELLNMRLEKLLQIPAAKWFLSLEPLLERVALPPFSRIGYPILSKFYRKEGGFDPSGTQPERRQPWPHWIITGCESGQNARPMELDWIRAIRDQCQSAGVPFFFKQAMIDGQLVKMPELDGKVWNETP